MDKTVLLMGLPNVGKSVLFNRLTGLNVKAANYGGTTVEYAVGKMDLGNTAVNLVDVPGTYSLQATNQAEAVAVKMLESSVAVSAGSSGQTCHCESNPCSAASLGKPSSVIFIVDAGNMEGSLYLLLQVVQKRLPMVVVLNRSDLAREKGYKIDHRALSRELGVPVVPTVAVTGEGIEDLKKALIKVARSETLPVIAESNMAGWTQVESLLCKILKKGQQDFNTPRERWGELLTKPWPGLALAVIIIAFVFGAVVGLGLLLRQQILLPFFRYLIFPNIEMVVVQIIPEGFIQNIFIGEYGFLIKGIEWPFALVLPYVISFYFTLSFLEDSGYMPRLGILLEGLLNRIGLKGTGFIPLLLGYGCAIPAILSTRALNTKKERLIATTVICLAIPCIAQTGSFIALLSASSVVVMIAVFFLGFIAMITAALILNRLLEGEPSETLVDIPDLLLPRVEVLLKKIWLRIKNFVVDGALPMVVAVAAAAVFYETGLMVILGEFMRPLVVVWLGLPPEASVPLILGVFRRELTVLPLLDMDLNTLQLFTGATVGLFYVPCVAVIASITREFNVKTAMGILLVTTLGAFLIGGIIYQLGRLFI